MISASFFNLILNIKYETYAKVKKMSFEDGMKFLYGEKYIEAILNMKSP